MMVVESEQAEYPQRIKAVLRDKAPKVLHIWGNLELLHKPSVGFCGSRNVSEKGLQVTADAVQQIIELDWVVVSDHARGVDFTAHKTALENGGATIIVAAEGLSHFKLKQELKKLARPEQLLIISEFAPNARWSVGNAMTRNKTILALSDAMVLVESRLEGGTFNAGESALRFKIPLFVAQYQIASGSNAGNEHFLKRGATALLKSPQSGRANILPLKASVLGDKKGTQLLLF